MKGRLLAISLCLLLRAACAWSQQVDGNLEGRIFDAAGQPLADANIVASGPSLQGTRQTLSDRVGYFRLAAVPVGVYTVRVSQVAHRPVSYENVLVELGQTTSLGNINLEKAVVELPQVVVSGRRVNIDPATTTLGMTFPATTFEALPTDRNFRSIVALTPEANTSVPGEEASVAGSTGEGNYYFIDGTDATDPGTGGTSTNLPYDFVRAIEIKTGGYEAEFGRALGAIVNVITPSGGNEYHGEVFGYFTDHRLVAAERNELLQARGGFSTYDVGAAMGGPIIHEKLWWFGAYNPAFDSRDVEVPGIPTQEASSRFHRIAGKLTLQASTKTSMNLTVLGDPTRSRIVGVPFNIAGPPARVLNEDAVVATTRSGGINVSLNGLHQVRSNMLLKASLSTVHNRSYVNPISERGRTEPYLFDVENSTGSGGYGGENKNHQDRNAGRFSAALFLGRHAFKSGLEYTDNAITNDIQFGAGKAHRGFLTRVNDTTFVWFQGFQIGTVHTRLPTAYLQDSWQIDDRLRLNVGLRWDGTYFINSSGETALQITDGYQPRVGLIYLLGVPGSQKLFGSYGRFYEQIPANSPGYYFVDAEQIFIGYDHDPLLDPSGGDSTVLLANPPGTSGVKGEYFDEFTLGYERELADRFRLGIRGRYRTLGLAVDDAYSPSAGRFVIGNPGRGNLSHLSKATQRYQAVELTFEKSDGGKAEFLASYVLSRNQGNYAGLIFGNAGPQFDIVETTINAEGLLPNDRTHVLKFYGSYRFGPRLTAGTTWLWQSGTPVSELGAIPNVPYTLFLKPRGSAGRTPSLWDLSFRLAYDAPVVRESIRPKLVLDLFHTFSPRRAILLDEHRYFSADTSGNQGDLNPNFLAPTLYQPAFSARFGTRIEF